MLPTLALTASAGNLSSNYFSLTCSVCARQTVHHYVLALCNSLPDEIEDGHGECLDFLIATRMANVPPPASYIEPSRGS